VTPDVCRTCGWLLAWHEEVPVAAKDRLERWCPSKRADSTAVPAGSVFKLSGRWSGHTFVPFED
jgi:hypothetical protein